VARFGVRKKSVRITKHVIIPMLSKLQVRDRKLRAIDLSWELIGGLLASALSETGGVLIGDLAWTMSV